MNLNGRCVAAFIEKFENFQVLEFTGAQFQTFNVPKAQTKGVEIETVANFTDNLTFNGGLTLLNAKYPDDCDKGREDVANVATLCGNTLTNAPKTVGIAGLSYANDFNDDLKFFVNGQLRYEGDRRTSTQAFTVPNAAAITAAGSLGAAISAASPVPFDVQEANTKINMRVGLGDQDDKWMFELWGTNITDVVTRGVTFNTTLRSGSRSAFVQDPATYGATIRTTF